MRGKKQSHCKKLFSVRSSPVCILGTVQTAGPGKIPLAEALRHPHISAGPLPDAVKLFLHVHLHTHHHAVGHSLGSGIMISGILQIPHVLTGRMVDPFLLRSIEKGVENTLQLLFYLCLALAHLHEKISIFPVLKLCHKSYPHILPQSHILTA